MPETWEERTCETCKYRVKNACRKNPPTVLINTTYYPCVVWEDKHAEDTPAYKYFPACSQYYERYPPQKEGI
jgi:hypothetical protein